MTASTSCALGLIAAGLLAGWSGAALAQDACVRSEPSPLFASPPAGVRAHSFTPKSSHEGEENFFFGRNVRVEVSHGGCEYYVTTYRFSSPSLFADGYSLQKAYAAAASLLGELARLHPRAGNDPGLAAATLAAQARTRAKLALDKEMTVAGDGEPPLEGQVKVDAAGRQGTIGFVQVTLFKGPM